MRKTLITMLTAALLLLPLTALAADSGADPLLLSEVDAWAAHLMELARAEAPLNDPHDSEALGEDGYAYVYDFGTLYMDSPDLTDDTVLRAAVLLTDEEAGPRGIRLNDTSATVLNAFYSENPALIGSSDQAVLYVSDGLPGASRWGNVLRDGQRLEAIQYAVHEPIGETGLYSDAGLVFTIQADGVAAIRAYGLNQFIEADHVEATLRLMEQAALENSYSAVPVSDAGDLPAFGEDDLVFSGINFLHATPEDAAAAYGQPVEDEWMDDDGRGWLRTMDFGGCELTFRYDSAKQHPQLTMLTVGTDSYEAPRGVRLGDSFASVLRRFRFEVSPNVGLEPVALYGAEDQPAFGLATYAEDASATLRYGLTTAEGQRVVLSIAFTRMEASEIVIYRAE